MSSPPNPPKWWFRYVDESHLCVKREHADQFPSHINSINPHLKFTIEIDSEGCIVFLDTKTTDKKMALSPCLSSGKLLTPTFALISIHTHHPQDKHSVVRTLVDRAMNIPSSEEEVSRETKRIAKAFAANFIHNIRPPTEQTTRNE